VANEPGSPSESDSNLPPGPGGVAGGGGGAPIDLPIEEELKQSYLTYAMSVIVSRALPDVRDGLKPSQRRILVAMNELNLGPTASRAKCAKIAGETMGNYHPHGQEVIYPTLVRMAQEWNMRHVLVDKQGNFYFIEVNARIQVEHPVTELVTGIDLIQMQLRVASGEKLPFTQEDIVHRGCAIECRICAEDPAKNFQPCPGKIEKMYIPGGYGVRWDSHAHAGYVVPPNYDSMIGKLLVHRPTRNEAIAAMQRALSELRIEGIRTTVPLLKDILGHNAFVEGRVDTTFIERTWTT